METVPSGEQVKQFKKIANMDFSKIGPTVSIVYVGFHQQNC